MGVWVFQILLSLLGTTFFVSLQIFCCPFFQSIHDHDDDNIMMIMMMMRGGGSGGGGVVGFSSCCW